MAFQRFTNYFTQQLYASFEDEVDQIFLQHFGLEDDFKLVYNHLVGIKRITISRHLIVRQGDKTSAAEQNIEVLGKIIPRRESNVNVSTMKKERLGRMSEY